MNLDERLNKDKEKREKRARTPDPDEDEETLMYAEREPAQYLNKAGSSSFATRMRTGINTADNVFDRSSIFRT